MNTITGFPESLASLYAIHNTFMSNPSACFDTITEDGGWFTRKPSVPKCHLVLALPLGQPFQMLPQCSEPHMLLIAQDGKNGAAGKIPVWERSIDSDRSGVVDT